MAINVSVQSINGGLLPDIILSTQCSYHRGTRLKAMKRFCIYSLSIVPPKRFDIFPPTGGCSEGLDALRFFFINNSLRRFSCVEIFLKKGRRQLLGNCM